MHLQFKATENFKSYHEPGGIFCKNGDIVEVDDKKGRELLEDYPGNFFKVTVEEIEADLETEVEETTPVIETAPNKMVTETKPRRQKRKGRK